MTFSSRLTPQDQFPEQLEALTTDALEILNSKLHRQAELEYQQEGEPELETRFRLEFLAEELDKRDSSGTESAQDAGSHGTQAPASPESARMANA
ncbi:hypothetical protein [Arthrobacter sunyaminii]|uniref:Uncharacterized protein n=1 Tax=Arthrobacter sunyaminii TaxID=2816859 RepID=A0A975PDU2_9MICC|nr:hypothetical protein [Arthrobacter sunyaminii]MBO0895444.1 hypothetical protein [Arthrobacter sunyaminii]MBO0907098.1 hypothetical protein [Arthrobacter sunyaminii]QWQ34727.1 hypothetical protein KG104_09100 [Arthrobacter sunyaminii]